MIELKDMQFEILPSEDSERDGYAWGIGRRMSINEGGFNPGDAECAVQDGTSQTRGTTLLGRDIPTAGSWSWAMHTNLSDEREALAEAGLMRRAWSPPNGRPKWEPGELTTIRYRLSRRVRRVYGRPRRFAQAMDNGMLSGKIPVNADFRLVDPKFYEDEVQLARLGWTQRSQGGFVFPMVFPASSLPSGNENGSALVGGDTSTYPVVRFNGPVSSPSLTTRNWQLTLRYAIPDGESVTVDLRPWHLEVMRSDGVSLAGKLGRRQYLEDMYFLPGQEQLSFRGAASSGGASCDVSWRNAWSTL